MAKEDHFSCLDAAQPVAQRMRAIFGLKALHTDDAVKALEQCLRTDPSALVRHEVAYVLGQMREKSAIPTLETTLNDEAEEVIVRHEAAEALGAISDMSTLPLLEGYARDMDAPRELRETCQLAVAKITQENSTNPNFHSDGTTESSTVLYKTVDPVAPTNTHIAKSVPDLRAELCNEDNTLLSRYSAMFALRNRGGEDAIRALCAAIESDSCSALFRHEVAYVLGQIASPISVPSLTRVLCRLDESSMVRHEAAEALGAIGGSDVDGILKRFAKDRSQVVRESIYVALDISDYVTSDQLDYTHTVRVDQPPTVPASAEI